MFQGQIKHSSSATPLLFLLIASSDHITGLTGATPTVTISKNGGAFASPSGAVTEIANGWYMVAGNATDTNTLGPIALHATATGADPFDDVVALIVAYDPQAATNLGLSDLDAAVSSRLASGNVTVGGYAAGEDPATLLLVTPANKLATDAGGNVSVTSNIKKNAALNNFGFVMTDSTNHAPKTALTVTATRSLDGATFAACANAPTEQGNGWYSINLAAADMNANTVRLRFTATAADDLDIEIMTQP